MILCFGCKMARMLGNKKCSYHEHQAIYEINEGLKALVERLEFEVRRQKEVIVEQSMRLSKVPYKPSPKPYWTHEWPTGRQVLATVVAISERDCLEGVAAYGKEYIPAGYGTGLNFGPKEVHPGVWLARIQRSASCE